MDFNGIVTELDQAKPVFERMFEISKKRIELLETQQRLTLIGEHVKANNARNQIAKLKTEISLLRDSIEYVRIKTFILCAKSFLTKEQMISIWENVDKILQSPEIHLISKDKN